MLRWSLFLFATLLFAPLVLSSRTSSASSRITVVGIHADPKLQTRAAQLAPLLRDAFRQSPRFTTLTEEATLQALQGQTPALREATFASSARGYLREARIYVEQAAFSKAIELLHLADGAFYYFREHRTSNEDFIEIQTLLSQLFLGLGEPERADEPLRALASRAPAHPLEPGQFPPQIVQRLAQLKQELASSVTLEVTSTSRGARVYLDGTPRGETPVTLNELARGYHFTRIEDPVAGTFFRDLQLPEAGVLRIEATFSPPHMRSADPEAAPRAASDGVMLIGTYMALGRALQLDFLPIASLSDDGLEVQLLHVPTGALSASYQAVLPSSAAAAGPALRNLVRQFEGLLSLEQGLRQSAPLALSVDLNSNSHLSAYFFPSERARMNTRPLPSVLGSPAPVSPLYRRRWFWAVVGGMVVASAGGTAAGLRVTAGGPGGASLQFNLPTP